MKFLSLLILTLSPLIVAGCTPVGAGLAVGSTAGVAAAREGGIVASLEDTKISAKIHDLWFRHDFEMFSKLNLTVDQGRVLITGVVQKPEHRVEAVRLAWQADGVRQVINEIKVDKSEGIKGWARDNWISSRLRAAILFDKDIQSVNYSIDTVQGIVYLMGIAQNQEELNRVMSHARTIPYVKQVVSYVKLSGTPMNQVLPPAMPDGSAAPMPGPVAAEPLPGTSAPLQGYPTYPNAPATGGPGGRPQPIIDQGF
jgi:osmotically-inducible protein OsmY